MPLNLVGSGHAGGQHRRAFRLHRRHPDGGVPGLQILPHAGDGAAGADACHEPVHLPAGILPDLRPSGVKVGLGVGGVNELAGDEAAGDLPASSSALAMAPPHALGPLGEHQLRAIGLHQLAALHAHGFRHDDDHPIAPGGGHGCQADAGVAGGGLDDDAVLMQQALASASPIMARAMRSFTDPAGFRYSSLARIRAFRPYFFSRWVSSSRGCGRSADRRRYRYETWSISPLYCKMLVVFSADGHLTTSENHRRFHGNDLGS